MKGAGKTSLGLAAYLVVLGLATTSANAQQVTGTPGSPSATTSIDGKQIPPPPPKFGGVIKEDAKDSTPWWPPRVVPPKGAPNVRKTVFTYTGENANIPDGNAPNVLGRDFTISAELTIPSGGAEGVVVAEGGMIGGYGLYLTHSFNWWLKSDLFKKIGLGLLILGLLLLIGNAGRWRKRFGYAMLLIAGLGLLMVFATDIFGFGRGRPVFVYNMLDLERFRWRGSALDEGKHTIVFNFKYEGPGVGKGGVGVLTVDGKEVDRKSMEHTIPFLLPADESFDVGLDTRTPVDFTYDCPFRFTGSIDKLTFNLGPSQLSAEDQRNRDEAIANANN